MLKGQRASVQDQLAANETSPSGARSAAEEMTTVDGRAHLLHSARPARGHPGLRCSMPWRWTTPKEPALGGEATALPCAFGLPSARLVRKPFNFSAQPLFLLPQFWREFSTEVLDLEQRANFDFGLAFHGIGAAPDPFDSLIH